MGDEIRETGAAAMMYHPYPPNYRQPQPAPPETTLPMFKAAEALRATYLSNDGKRAYTKRFGMLRVHFWDGVDFGSGFPCGDKVPEDAVEL